MVKRSDLPPVYIAASDASRAGQRSYTLFVQWDLLLVLVAAAFGSVWPFVERDTARLMGLGMALLLGLALFIRSFNRRSRNDRWWYDGRAVAETIKTIAWQYMMRTEPYIEDATANERLSRDLRESVAGRPELQARLGDVDFAASSPEMIRVRGLSLQERRECYLHDRLNDQSKWYSDKSRALALAPPDSGSGSELPPRPWRSSSRCSGRSSRTSSTS
ncbi:MAG: DUF4231 domain-containing protein [Chloroflexia bacterium]